MIPYSNYHPEDWDENGNIINRDRIEVSKLIVDYTQPGDCAEDVENYQTIRLESENNGTAPSFIMRNLVYTKVYADIEIGTPKEYIQIPLNFESNDFYISQNPKKDFFKKPEKLDELKFYNYSNSKTCVIVEEGEYNGDNFKLSKYYKDVFYFKEEKVELEFYLPDNITEAESGGIGKAPCREPGRQDQEHCRKPLWGCQGQSARYSGRNE